MEQGSLAMIFINIASDKTNSEKGKNDLAFTKSYDDQSLQPTPKKL